MDRTVFNHPLREMLAPSTPIDSGLALVERAGGRSDGK